MRVPETRSRKDGRWRTSTLRDGVSLKTPRGRQWQTTPVNLPRKPSKRPTLTPLSGDAWSRRSPGLIESTAQTNKQNACIYVCSLYNYVLTYNIHVCMYVCMYECIHTYVCVYLC